MTVNATTTPKAISLRPLFEQLLSDDPPSQAVNAFLRHCQRIAVAYLRRRSRLGRLRLELFDLTEEDLALDCLAELFRRDEGGAYVQLRSYAESVGWAWLDDVEAEIAVRRIVFSAVNEGLFRRYRESDPAVGRLIRTLKRHVKRQEALVLLRERSVLVVRLRGAGPAEMARPQMPQELLEAYLHGFVDARCTLPRTLAGLAELFRTHAEYSPRVALSDLALSIRSVLVRRGAAASAALDESEHPYEERDLQEAIRQGVQGALAEVQEGMRPLYVERRGVSPDLYGAYFRAIQDILTEQFVEPGRPEASYRGTLNTYLGKLSSQEYRQKHQAVMEYLINLTKRQLLQRASPLV
jgi:hypothetical protein